jgi:2-polyprenyl-3-methyl-5-hydroxy-6-metoxy-1,4-benzoquinol methylase
MNTANFWEQRARRYAGEGAGLRAVCSYAMPRFYNWSIDCTQRAALDGLLKSIQPGERVLDYGCGVGRWTREIARRGADVTALDFSAAMLEQARLRTEAAGLLPSCRFVQGDVSELHLPERFHTIFGVTVLQHVLNDVALGAAIGRLAAHLRPGGRLIMVEAAPQTAVEGAETATFRARTLADYRNHLRAAGLEVDQVRGVDPSPLKLMVVPRFRRWPAPLAHAALHAATALSLPLDLLGARLLTRYSWHKIIVASRSKDRP